MKQWILLLSLVIFLPVASYGEDFLGAPVLPQGTATKKTDDRLEMKTGLSHDEVIAFYREALKDFQDIKFRDWKDSTYIEDDGRMPWHSITVSKGGETGTEIIIVKDNWTWIIGTLILRYIGVFMVLMVLLIGMSVSGRIISRSVASMDAKKAG
ncbi:MAG: hypothetical protein R6X27_05465 [Candidatus Desulfacyla sp.]